MTSAVTDDFGWAIRAISTTFRAAAELAVADIPSGGRGYLVLLAAGDGEPRAQAVIARQLELDRTIMTYLVDALVGRGLVERRADPADRRVRLLVLTDAGTAVLEAARAQIDAVEERLLAALDPDQRSTFRTLLATVAQSAGAVDTCS